MQRHQKYLQFVRASDKLPMTPSWLGKDSPWFQIAGRTDLRIIVKNNRLSTQAAPVLRYVLLTAQKTIFERGSQLDLTANRILRYALAVN